MKHQHLQTDIENTPSRNFTWMLCSFFPLTSVRLCVSPGHFTSPHLLYSQGEEMQSWTSCRWASIHQHILSDHLLQYFDYWALKNSTKKNGRSRRPSSHFLEFADHDISFQWTPNHLKLQQGCAMESPKNYFVQLEQNLRQKLSRSHRSGPAPGEKMMGGDGGGGSHTEQ